MTVTRLGTIGRAREGERTIARVSGAVRGMGQRVRTDHTRPIGLGVDVGLVLLGEKRGGTGSHVREDRLWRHTVSQSLRFSKA